jgi:hypothetical protein
MEQPTSATSKQMQTILQEPTSFTALAEPLLQEHQTYPQQQGILQQILNHTTKGSTSTMARQTVRSSEEH